jgi:hypothetical protein
MARTRDSTRPISHKRISVLVACILFAATCGGCNRTDITEYPIELGLAPSFLQFSATVGEIVSPQAVTVQILAHQTWPWRAIASESWISVAPATGVGNTGVLVSVATRGLAPGVHQATVDFVITDVRSSTAGVTMVVVLTLTAPGWSALNGPYGGVINTLAADPDLANRVLAGENRGNIYVSNDGGQTFSWAAIAAPSAILSLTMGPNGRVYAGTGADGVFRSDDRGLTWKATSMQNLAVSSVAASPTDADRVVASGSQAWLSADGGSSWNQISLPDNADFMAPDKNVSGVVVFGDAHGNLYRGDGSAFSTVATGSTLPATGFASLPTGEWFVALHSYCGAFAVNVSLDGGVSWTPSGTGLPTGACQAPVWLVAEGTNLWGLRGNIYVSTNRGAFFDYVSLAVAPSARDKSVFNDVVSSPAGALVAHGGEGILRYAPAQGLVPMAIFAHDVRALSFHSATATLMAVTSANQVFRYRETTGFVGSVGTGLPAWTTIRAISADPRDPNTILVAIIGGGVYGTTDGGNTWQAMNTGITAPTPLLSAIDRAPDNPDVIFVCGSDDLFKSTDAGSTFTNVRPATCCNMVGAISQELVIVGCTDPPTATASAVLANTANGGTTTLAAGTQVTLAARTLDGSVWYGDRNTGIWRSTDNGNTFTNLGLASTSFCGVAVYPSRPERIFLCVAGSGLLISSDDGATWEVADSPFPATVLAMDANSGQMFVGTSGGGIYRYVP